MIIITKKEKEKIERSFPDVYIVRTMKQKSKRHRYYCEERPSIIRYLKDMREKNVIYSYGSSRGSEVHNGSKP